MTSTATPNTPRVRNAKPSMIRRRIMHRGVLPGEIHLSACYSMTRAGHAIQHHQEVDLTTGEVRCNCEDFLFRHAIAHPHFDNTDHHCKHLAPCLAWLRRHHYLEASPAVLRPCLHCGVADAEFGLADENGHEVEGGFICADCVKRARMMDAGTGQEATGKNEPAPMPAPYAGFDEYLDELDAADDGTCPRCGAMLEELPVPATGQSLDYSMEWVCPHCDVVEVAA